MRLRRRMLLNFLTVLSLLLCVAAVVLWVRRYRVGDVFYAARFDDRGPWTFRVRDELVVSNGVVGFTRSVASGARATYRAVVEKSRDAARRRPVADALESRTLLSN